MRGTVLIDLTESVLLQLLITALTTYAVHSRRTSAGTLQLQQVGVDRRGRLRGGLRPGLLCRAHVPRPPYTARATSAPIASAPESGCASNAPPSTRSIPASRVKDVGTP